MTMTESPATTATADAMRAASARRLAARAEFVMNDRPARRLPPKSRRHSVKHRAIR